MIRLSRPGLGVALAVALAAAPTVRASEPDKLLPAETDTVIAINLRQIIDSDIIKKYALEKIKEALQDNEAQKVLSELGLDPLKDVHRVVVSGSGKDQTDMKFLIIVHGKFDLEKLDKAVSLQTKQDKDHYSLIVDGQDKMFKYQPDTGNPLYIALVDEATVILANSKKSIRTALATAKSSQKPAISRELATLLASMDDKASLWMASVVKGKLDGVNILNGPGVSPNLKALLSKLDSVSVVIRVTTDVSLDISLGMADTTAAAAAGQEVDQGLQMVKGFAPALTAQNPQMKPLADVLQTIKNTVKEKSVVISAKLSGTAIEQMVKAAGK
jgi:hypothetical protein